MEIELYLIKFENRKTESRITWDYIIQCSTKNVKITSMFKLYKTVPKAYIVAQIQRALKFLKDGILK